MAACVSPRPARRRSKAAWCPACRWPTPVLCCPALHTQEADPAADLRALDALAGWCGRYTPWTAVDPDGGRAGAAGLWLDISGCAHLFGGEEALLRDLIRRLSRQGFVARAAVAATPGAAWAVARFAALGREGIAVVPEGGLTDVLASLPVAALRLEVAAVEGLDRVGLRRVGDLIPLPRAPLAARYGTAVLKRLDQALGRNGESLTPRVPVPPLLARMAFAEPIGRAEDIAAAVRRLLDDLCVQMDAVGTGARRLELTPVPHRRQPHRDRHRHQPSGPRSRPPGNPVPREAGRPGPRLRRRGDGPRRARCRCPGAGPGRSRRARGGGAGRGAGAAGRPGRQPPGRGPRVALRRSGQPYPRTGQPRDPGPVRCPDPSRRGSGRGGAPPGPAAAGASAALARAHRGDGAGTPIIRR